MKKILLLLCALLTGVGGAWATFYVPTKRVTAFESDKMYMLYNTCIDGNQDRTGFIYVDGNGSMKKYTGTNRNPKQFITPNTAYLWKVVTGNDNHVSLQNVFNSKYYGSALGQNDSDPNNLFLYPWGDLASNQAGANSQNEDDPSQKTINADITFDINKVFIIGDGNSTFWNGNPGDIVTWSTGHPFAFYEIEEASTYTVDGTVKLSDIGYADYTIINIPEGSTLNIDVDNFDLTKLYGAGTVVLDADNNSLTGSTNKSTFATGKLTINEGKTLTIGTGDSQAHSIESFTSIELAGTLKHQNKVATLNNVTVPTGKTGKIFAFDMGSDADAFKLAGTTTLNGNLTVLSRWNAQIKVNELSGSGTWLICGTNGNEFDDTKTTSSEAATINVTSASSYTGDVTVNNSKATVNLSGSLVGSSWTKTNGTLNYAGASLNGTTLDGVILTGSARIGTDNTVNIKNLAGNNLNNTDHLYAFVGSGTINFYGVCDLTKKSDGTVCNSANIGYGSSANVIIKAGANVTAGVVLNSSTLSSNAPITVEATATLTAVGSTHVDNSTLLIYSTNLTNNGTINLNASGRKSIVSALSGSGTLNVAAGTTISAPSVPNTMTLTGAGDVVLTSFPTSTAPTLSSWTGAIEFPDKENATSITEILNAWGNENSTIKLNNLKGYFSSNTIPVNPTLNILENKTLNINNGYSDFPPILSKLTGKGGLNISWGSCGDQFNLTIQKLFEFDGTLATAKAPIYVTKLVLATEPAGDALLLKTSATGVTLSDIYVGEDDITAVCSKKVKTVADVTGYYVTNKQDAVDAIAPYISFIGSSVGKYTVTLGSTPYTNASELETVISGWATLSDCVEPIITINQPTSAFYRIKSGSKYLQDVRKGDDATQRTLTDAVGANESAETIFYLNDNTFVGYKTGFGFGYSVCQTQNTEQLNTQLFTESAEKGKYTIQSQQGTCASADYNEGYWGIDDSDLSRVADAASGACWTIETVTSLPITISAAGYATLYSPVALTIPGGVTAYVATDMGDYLHLEAIGDDIIPAATGVILKGAAGTYDFAITTSGTAVSELTGTIATIAKPADAYYLSNGASGIGFYKSGTATTIPGFRAYLLASGGNVKSFRFDIPTAIEQIENEQQNEGSSTIYNLAGQRVNKAQKGIYIVNGKKVAVK